MEELTIGIFFKDLFIYLFIGCGGVFVVTHGLSPVLVHGFLIAMASCVADYRLLACRLQYLWHMDSVVEVHRLICFAACGILPDKGLNQCPLHCKADSQPLDH